MAHARAHIADVGAKEVCAAAGVSGVRFAVSSRRDRDELAAVPADHASRAMAILAGDRSVLDVATEVGFESLSGFSRAFLRLCVKPERHAKDRASMMGRLLEAFYASQCHGSALGEPGSPHPDA
jgi:hypothetical protein